MSKNSPIELLFIGIAILLIIHQCFVTILKERVIGFAGYKLAMRLGIKHRRERE